MGNIRVALLSKGDVHSVGGVQTSVQRLAHSLSEHGPFHVDMITLRPDLDGASRDGWFDETPSTTKDGVAHFELAPFCTSPDPSERGFAMHLALVELCRRRAYDLVHGFYASTAGFSAAYVAMERGLASVVSLRGNDIHRDIFHGSRLTHLRWALEHATQVTAVSREALHRADILSRCGNKGRCILNSVDPTAYHEGSTRPEMGSPVIGAMAKFRSKKGLTVLLRAFRLLLKDFPEAHLWLVGDIIDEEKESMHRAMDECGLGRRVTLTGFVPRHDALRFLRGMDVFVLPSLHEGCPNVLLEAMLAGAPIVATRVGAVPEMLVDGREGILVEPASVPSLHAGIVSMLRGDRSSFSRHARDAALTRFSPQRERDAFIEVYEEALRARVNPTRARS
ncbi:glycosyltransferase [Pendulispora brunnea]|uniref:Glycosyltransferase n=1 Tax=Pendulispora brunnea TaxID=2905690 RepID=A0ABZ2KAC1_9BACT